MECKKESNLKNCTCTYSSCRRHAVCCDCVQYHLQNRELPGCFFPPAAEKTYDRSFEFFAQLVADGKA